MCGTNPNWINTIRACPIRAIYVAADGPNGWALGALGELFYYISDQNEWFEVLYYSTHIIVAISSGPDSSLIATTANGEVLQYIGGIWTTVVSQVGVIKNIAIADTNSYFYTTTNGKVFKSYNGTQMELPTTWSPNFLQLSTVPAMDHMWGMTGDTTDNVFFWGGDWRILPGKSVKQFNLHYDATKNQVQAYGVDRNGNGWLYNFVSAVWDPVTRATFGNRFETIESSNGFIWAATAQGVYRGTI